MDLDTRCQIFYECHDSQSLGRLGIQKTYILVQKQFYSPRLHKDVEAYVLHCQKCQVNKAKLLKAGGLMHPLEIPNGKWKSISMDFIVRLSTTNHGHDAIWVVVDCLTKMCRFIPTKAIIKTPKLAWLFMKNFYKLYGLPNNIISDRNQKFTSHFWRVVFRRLDTMPNLSTVDHPQTDGKTERLNQVLEDML